jgi:hypothetical protein
LEFSPTSLVGVKAHRLASPSLGLRLCIGQSGQQLPVSPLLVSSTSQRKGQATYSQVAFRTAREGSSRVIAVVVRGVRRPIARSRKGEHNAREPCRVVLKPQVVHKTSEAPRVEIHRNPRGHAHSRQGPEYDPVAHPNQLGRLHA